jgi:hypothetical protein
LGLTNRRSSPGQEETIMMAEAKQIEMGTTTARELDAKGIFRGAGIGAVAGAIGNVAVFLAGSAAGVPMVAEFQKGAPPVALALPQVAIASLVPGLAAALFALALNRFTAKPSKIFLGVAVVFGLFSMGGPASLPGASAGLKAVLALMHVVSGVAITAGILRAGRAR